MNNQETSSAPSLSMVLLATTCFIPLGLAAYYTRKKSFLLDKNQSQKYIKLSKAFVSISFLIGIIMVLLLSWKITNN
ncbi:hypothetical protein [uncultured Pedobacter sp.]|uniref:hypothetical protein n=1 Tax=uncultured Pedobacter sp. TaxID=246139 RepID=UPI0026077F1F|nr:hypothetical protein [uncultured Pedobacter sp.]